VIELVTAFILGWALSWPGLIALLVLGTIFEANEAHGWAMFMGVVSAVIAYFFFAIPLTTLLAYAAGYVAVGFVWSFWRYKRHKDKIVEEYSGRSLEARKLAVERLQPSRMLDKITTWVLIWPFSMFENVLGDFIKIVQTFITKFFKGIYTRIYLDGANKLVPVADEEGSKV
jgi:hypothetical protein